MFEPGEVIEIDLSDLSITRSDLGLGTASGGEVFDVVTDSVVAHLRSDVPLCCLLSGGLDSSICASTAVDRVDAAALDHVKTERRLPFVKQVVTFLQGTGHRDAGDLFQIGRGQPGEVSRQLHVIARLARRGVRVDLEHDVLLLFEEFRFH